MDMDKQALDFSFDDSEVLIVTGNYNSQTNNRVSFSVGWVAFQS